MFKFHDHDGAESRSLWSSIDPGDNEGPPLPDFDEDDFALYHCH